MSENILFSDGALYAHHTLDPEPDPTSFYLHTHESLEIYYFIRGDAGYTVEGNRYELSPGDVLIMKPTEAHRLQLNSSVPYERISIHFSPETLGAWHERIPDLLAPFDRRALGQGNLYTRRDFGDSSYETYIRKTLSPESDRTLARFCLESNLFGFLIELYHAWLTRTEPPVQEQTDPIAAEMIAYINRNLTGELSVGAIAAHVFLGQTRAKRLFREATGISIWNYVMIKRLHYARAAIRNGCDLQTISIECGYRDYASFYRAYLKFFGRRPNEDKPNKKRVTIL